MTSSIVKIFKVLFAMFYLQKAPHENKASCEYSSKSVKSYEVIVDPKDAMYINAPDFMNQHSSYLCPADYLPILSPTTNISPK